MSIKTAVIPVAGYGTRFFPASRVIPKALLPIFDTPGIQFVVEEAVNSGIQKLIFVISSDQDLIRQYFSESNKIDEVLKKKGMSEKMLKELIAVVAMANETNRLVESYQVKVDSFLK